MIPSLNRLNCSFVGFSKIHNNKFSTLSKINDICSRINEKKTQILQNILSVAIEQNASFNKKTLMPTYMAKAAILCGAPINRQYIHANDAHNHYHIIRCANYKANDIAKLLIKNEVNVNVTSQHGHSPIIIVANRYNYNYELAEELIKAGADVNHQDNNGVTALMNACNIADSEMIDLLIAAGADAKIVDNQGNNALFYLIKSPLFPFSSDRESFLQSMKNLIRLSDIDFCDKDGNTALMKASEKRYFELFNLLLDANANIEIENNFGQTFLDFALQPKFTISGIQEWANMFNSIASQKQEPSREDAAERLTNK